MSNSDVIEQCDKCGQSELTGYHLLHCSDYTDRRQVLRSAEALIHGDRQQDYGDPRESFARLASLWSATLGHEVTPAQVALCLLQLKVSRLCVTPDHADSWIDAAGYAALGAEVARAGR